MSRGLDLPDPPLELPPEILPRIQRRNHVPSHIRESPRQVHSGDIGLIAEDQNRVEIEVGPVKARQDDRGQAGLVPVRNAIEEHLATVPFPSNR